MPDKNVLSISACAPFSFHECLWFLDRNYDDCMHRLSDGEIRKAIRFGKESLLFKLFQSKGEIHAEIIVGPAKAGTKSFLKEYISDWLDLGRDLVPFYEMLAKDKKLRYMTEEFKGLRLIAIPDLFEALCWAIIGQQINLSFAHTLKNRLVERYGMRLEYQSEVYSIFPDPASLSSATVEELKALQFSGKKAEYLIGLAEIFCKGTLSREKLLRLPDLESRQKALLSIRGIGLWTANYVLMKSLKEISCVPYGDAGLVKALLNHNILKDRTDTKSMLRFFNKFRGWESYAVLYLWRSLAIRKED